MQPERVPRAASGGIIALLSLLAVPIIGTVDYLTGPDIGMSLLYLVPIAVSARFGGMRWTIAVACAAAASWLAADLAWRENDAAVAISIWNAFTRLVIYVSEGVFIAVIEQDRVKLRRLVELESSLARTDSLTGLANSRSFLESGERAIRAARAGAPIAALYVDLDNFKTFNDRLGHAAGDALLVEVGNVLTRAARSTDVAARIGGDEFVMLLQNVDETEAERIGAQVSTEIGAMASAYGDIRFGATVGVAHFSQPPETAEDLLRSADDAMYRGKAEGKSRVVMVRA